MPPAKYNYAEDVLCVTEGYDVRLITNVNVAAGLVNSASGTVVKVLFDNVCCHPTPSNVFSFALAVILKLTRSQ